MTSHLKFEVEGGVETYLVWEGANLSACIVEYYTQDPKDIRDLLRVLVCMANKWHRPACLLGDKAEDKILNNLVWSLLYSTRVIKPLRSHLLLGKADYLPPFVLKELKEFISFYPDPKFFTTRHMKIIEYRGI